MAPHTAALGCAASHDASGRGSVAMMQSGLSSRTNSPVVSRTPRFTPAAKPGFAALGDEPHSRESRGETFERLRLRQVIDDDDVGGRDERRERFEAIGERIVGEVVNSDDRDHIISLT
jgi:hypothetical protein